MQSEALALGSAVALALGSMFMGELRGRLDPTSVTRWSFVVATLMTGTAAVVVGGWATITPQNALYLAVSGFFAMVIAGPSYYGAIFSIGPGNALLIFSLNAPIAAFAGFLLFGERFSGKELVAVALILAGIALAVVFGERRPAEQRAAATSVRRRVPWIGIGYGMTAALGQGLGNVAAKAAMTDFVEPFAAMTVRSAAGAVILWMLLVLPFHRAKSHGHADARTLILILIGTGIGMGVGMTMLMGALTEGDVGIVSTLGAMTPVAILPMVWARTGVPPRWQAWLGAVVAVLGTAVLFGSGCLWEVVCFG
ncbi:MAG: DMT family transporter [Hyphomicrobiaceae bacterium]